jgi:UDPglucose 6-dehydrogenase
LELLAALLEQGAVVRAYDPIAMENTRAVFPNVEYCSSSYDAATGCDFVIVVTEWNEFKLLNLEKLKDVMKQPIIFDGRNIYDPKRLEKLGFRYIGVGRQPVDPLGRDDSTALA